MRCHLVLLVKSKLILLLNNTDYCSHLLLLIVKSSSCQKLVNYCLSKSCYYCLSKDKLCVWQDKIRCFCQKLMVSCQKHIFCLVERPLLLLVKGYVACQTPTTIDVATNCRLWMHLWGDGVYYFCYFSLKFF